MPDRRVDAGLVLFAGEGLSPSHVDPRASIIELGELGEAVAFDSIAVQDHLQWNLEAGPHGFWESCSILAALAAVTKRVRLATSVLSTPFRNPALVAKMAETVDMISGGRFVLGLGAGGGPPVEYESFAIPSDHRYARFAEAVEIIHGLLTEGHSTFNGNYYRTQDCLLRPRGPRPDGLPIGIAAEGPKMIDLAVRYADEWNGFSLATPSPDMFDPVMHRVDAACERAGRDPATLRRVVDITVAPTNDTDLGIPNLGTPIHGTEDEIAHRIVAFSDHGINEVRAYLLPQSPTTVEAMGRVLAAMA